MKILLVGSNGFLGSFLERSFVSDPLFSLTSTNRDQINLANLDVKSAERIFSGENFSHVIVAAAVTDVGKCHSDRAASEKVNVVGTKMLLAAARRHRVIPVFFSSDYVFGSHGKNYGEDSPRRPETEYGKQKLAVEEYLEAEFERFLILRTSKLMAKEPHSRSILTPLLRNLSAGKPVPCFTDQWVNPVFVEDVAGVVKSLLKNEANGVFHLGTEQVFTRHELGVYLADKLGFPPALVKPLSMKDLPAPEPRPHHNTLDCRKVREASDFRFTEVSEACPSLANWAKITN